MANTVLRVRPRPIDVPALGHEDGARTIIPSRPSRYRARRPGRSSPALLLAAGLVLGVSAASADMGEWLRNESLADVGGCESAINEATSEGVRCIAGIGLSRMLEEGTRLAAEHGKQAFGEHFQVTGSLAWSRNGSGLDAVFPFSFSAEPGGDSSLFFQSYAMAPDNAIRLLGREAGTDGARHG